MPRLFVYVIVWLCQAPDHQIDCAAYPARPFHFGRIYSCNGRLDRTAILLFAILAVCAKFHFYLSMFQTSGTIRKAGLPVWSVKKGRTAHGVKPV